MKNNKTKYYIDSYSKNFENIQLDVVQLAKGKFETILEEGVLGKITIKSVQTNIDYETHGLMDANQYGIFFCSPSDNVLMNNMQLDKMYVVIVPPNTEYYKLTKNESTQFSITINSELFEQFFSIYNFKIIELDKKSFNVFYTLCNSILHSPKNDIEYCEFQLLSSLKLFLTKENYLKDKKTYHDKFYDIIKYIKKYNLYDISINELALKFQVTDRTLRNIFYSSVGMSPKKYLKALQLNNLRVNLSQSDLTISQIIINEKLVHQSQLTKEFKEHFLKTPLEYKRLLDSLDY